MYRSQLPLANKGHGGTQENVCRYYPVDELYSEVMVILQLTVRQVYNFSNQETVTNDDEYRNEKKRKQQ